MGITDIRSTVLQRTPGCSHPCGRVSRSFSYVSHHGAIEHALQECHIGLSHAVHSHTTILISSSLPSPKVGHEIVHFICIQTPRSVLKLLLEWSSQLPLGFIVPLHA